jgi:hypothetical protein
VLWATTSANLLAEIGGLEESADMEQSCVICESRGSGFNADVHNPSGEFVRRLK